MRGKKRLTSVEAFDDSGRVAEELVAERACHAWRHRLPPHLHHLVRHRINQFTQFYGTTPPPPRSNPTLPYAVHAKAPLQARRRRDLRPLPFSLYCACIKPMTQITQLPTRNASFREQQTWSVSEARNNVQIRYKLLQTETCKSRTDSERGDLGENVNACWRLKRVPPRRWSVRVLCVCGRGVEIERERDGRERGGLLLLQSQHEPKYKDF